MKFVVKELDGRERVDLPEVLNVLKDEQLEVYHDDAYDTLSLLDGSYKNQLLTLVSVAEDQKAQPFARWYAVNAILKVIPSLHGVVPLLVDLLHDEDYVLRKKVAVALRNCAYQDQPLVLPALVSSVQDTRNHLDTQLASFTSLVKLTNLSRAISLLMGRSST